MSGHRPPIDSSTLPYKPRRKPSNRPDRPLPAPPPDEDVIATNAFEAAQHFYSPPSPPRAPSRALPPPPPPVPTTTTTESSSGAKTSASRLHPYVSALPDTAIIPPTTLTPLRAHYLKKTLVNLQMSHELNLLTDPILGANSLGLLGDPFVLTEAAKKDAMARISDVARAEGRLGDLPFMRFLFHQFILPFPFLTSAPPTFWSAKVQPFLSSFLATTGYTRTTTLSAEELAMAESLMTKEERHEVEERRKLWNKVEKHAGLMVGVGVKVVGGEEVVRIGQGDLRRLEEAQRERRVKWEEKQRAKRGQADGPPIPGAPPPPLGHLESGFFEVNVVGVRVVVGKGRVRHKSHDEFLIRTRRPGVGDVFVSRRYGDFKRLADELRFAFPDHNLPPPPPKDKSVTAQPVVAPQQYSYYNPMRMIYGSGSTGTPPSNSGTSTPAPNASSTFPDPASPVGSTTPLSREKNRLTLRAYLQSVLQIPQISDSPMLRSFLLSNPTILTPPEAMDCQRRLEADAVREEGRRRFREEAAKRVEALREGLAQFKGDVLSRDGGLRSVFDVVRRVERVEDLPRAEASVLEWGRISLAATIFQIFVASDTASDTLSNLKRLHGLMPYFVLKGILRISNPMAMIRGVLDLFLARPFGGQSLIQRMFSSSLSEDVRAISEDIEVVAEKIEDPVLCQKVEQFANAPFEIQEIYRKDAATEGLDLLVVILRSPDPPTMSRPQFQRVYRASRAYKEYKASQADLSDSDDDMGPENDDAWLFEDLSILLKLWMRKREKEQLLALIFEGVTAELLKDIITIFYTPLAQVYKAASIADSLGDLQTFLNDMIRTVEQVEELAQEDPQRTVQTFIDLVQRHEQSFYTFVHNVHAKGHGLFDSLMGWIELFLAYARDGLAQPVDLDFILPFAGPEREAIMAEVDAVAQYHYRLKVAHEEKVRRRFDHSGSGTGPEAEEAMLLESVMASLSLGDAAAEHGDMEEDDEEEEEDEEDGEGEEEDYGSEVSSIRSGHQIPHSAPPAITNSTPLPPPLPTPDHLDPNLPSLSPLDSAGAKIRKDKKKEKEKEKEKEKHRRNSDSQTTKSNFDKPRRSVDLSSKKPTTGSIGIGGGESTGERVKKGKRKGGNGKGARKITDVMEPPETKAIAELRPLFVEIVRPLLRVRQIQ
ncbi:hypothetical protein BCR39DRAFT_534242 [Naematelia encephala]|uniref:PX domain-containing protein n=1 Tax=Naematelia encephala TaxID=71784 RepID=A0A1Y2B265_9TREE|nr:hypothetical protein BCR39DRAFT_534242 [Naematelia encephala]